MVEEGGRSAAPGSAGGDVAGGTDGGGEIETFIGAGGDTAGAGDGGGTGLAGGGAGWVAADGGALAGAMPGEPSSEIIRRIEARISSIEVSGVPRGSLIASPIP